MVFLDNKKVLKFAELILKLAGEVGFEPTMTISKTVALGQARRFPNKKLYSVMCRRVKFANDV